jgi:hypothetical protein
MNYSVSAHTPIAGNRRAQNQPVAAMARLTHTYLITWGSGETIMLSAWGFASRVKQ